MNLALKYRPRTFDDVVGQKAVSIVLKAMIAKGVLDQALLFTGPSGVGKTSMARIIAAELNPEGAQEVHEGTHPAVLEIDAASSGGVETIRQLIRDLNYSIEGHRVVIIDEAHAMSDEAKTTLLKPLEFSFSRVTFILVTTESHRIPTTIAHRCDKYMFRRAMPTEILARLQYIVDQENIVISEDLLKILAQRSEGSFREAIMMLNKLSVANISSVDEYNNIQGKVDYGPDLIKAACEGPAKAVEFLDEILYYRHTEDVIDTTIAVLKDIMLLKSNIAIDSDNKDTRIALAKMLSVNQLIKAMKVMWDLQTKLVHAHPVRSLEMAFGMLGEILQISVSTETKSSVMSLAAMKNFQG